MINCLRKRVISRIFFREMCVSKTAGSTTKPPSCDMIGPPDSVSNLRPIIFCIPKNEHPIEREYRLCRQEVQKWNHDFWTKHNESFVKERKEFITANLPQKNVSDTETQTLSADDMSIFYKSFLDKNWKTHLKYNIKWYQKNVKLLFLALKVKVYKLKQ